MVWNDDHANAMRDVYRQFEDDLDVASLFAESLLNRTPWQMWNLQTGEPAVDADTVEATEVLEKALEKPATIGSIPACCISTSI